MMSVPSFANEARTGSSMSILNDPEPGSLRSSCHVGEFMKSSDATSTSRSARLYNAAVIVSLSAAWSGAGPGGWRGRGRAGRGGEPAWVADVRAGDDRRAENVASEQRRRHGGLDPEDDAAGERDTHRAA